MSVGTTGETGSMRSPFALCGIGRVGQGCSPGVSVSVETGVSMMGWIGSPMRRSSRYSHEFLLACASALTGASAASG